MKKKILNKAIEIIKIKYPEYNEEKLEIIEYGLEAIYLTISKAIIIFSLAILLEIFDKLVIFLLLFNFIRFVSFGLHAKRSSVCLIFSTIIFISLPILCNYLIIKNYIKIILFIPLISLIGYFSPADTEKRPIISKKRRKIYKILSILISIIYLLLSIYTKNNYLSNAFLFALILQLFMVNPLSYKLFKVPYNNYIRYEQNMVND